MKSYCHNHMHHFLDQVICVSCDSLQWIAVAKQIRASKDPNTFRAHTKCLNIFVHPTNFSASCTVPCRWTGALFIQPVLVFHIQVIQTALSGDRELLLVSYADETIRLWNARTGHEQCTVPVQTTIHWLSFAQQDNTVLAWVEKYKGKRSRIIKFDLNR